MEENTTELFDYLRVIWKRKILIIVVISVSIVVGVVVGVMNSRSKLPVTYHAEVVVKVGKKVKLMSSSGITTTSSSVEYIEDPQDLVETIPLRYGFNVNVVPGYHLGVGQVGQLSMLKLTLKGPDIGVERVLKELVDTLIDEHRTKAKDSVVAYNDFIKKLEIDAERVQEDITIVAASIKEMKNKEGEYLVNIESERTGIKEEYSGGDRSAFLNMLYLKTIDRERELSSLRASLRDIHWKLIMHKVTLGNLEEYKTEQVGEMKNTAIEPKRKKGSTTITVAGVAGLMMSLFIAFFIEYIEESKSKRKGK